MLFLRGQKSETKLPKMTEFCRLFLLMGWGGGGGNGEKSLQLVPPLKLSYLRQSLTSVMGDYVTLVSVAKDREKKTHLDENVLIEYAFKCVWWCTILQTDAEYIPVHLIH